MTEKEARKKFEAIEGEIKKGNVTVRNDPAVLRLLGLFNTILPAPKKADDKKNKGKPK